MRSRRPGRAGAFGSLPAPILSHRVVSRPRCMPAGFPRRVQAGGSNAPVTGPGTLSSAAARPSSIVAARSIPAPREDRPPAPRCAPRRNHVSEQAANLRRLAPVRFDTASDRLCECGIARFRAVAVWARTGTGVTRGAARIAAGDIRKRLNADCDSRSAGRARTSATSSLAVHYFVATPPREAATSRQQVSSRAVCHNARVRRGLKSWRLHARHGVGEMQGQTSVLS